MNSQKVYLVSRIVAGIIMALAVILFFSYVVGLDEDNLSTEDRAGIGTWVSYGYNLVYVVIGFAVLSMIYGMVTNPSTIKGTAIGVVGVLAVFAIAYGMSDGSDFQMYVDKGLEVDESSSRMVSTGLNAFIILAVGALLSVVYSAVSSLFK